MNNLVKNSFYYVVWIVSWSQSIWLVNAFSVSNSSNGNTSQLEWNNSKDMVSIIQWMVWYLVWLLYFIAVIVMLYWGFCILTAGWDEEWVKKWKKALINWAVWLIVIFLASSLVNWIIGLFWSGWDATVYINSIVV
jgi:hypothetical protein